MERLTWECELDGFADIGLRDGVTIDTAICRLSAYERTGLEPEEIDEIFDEYNAILKAIIKDGERMISIDRLHELAQADREGRCVVPPCKKGDTVWRIVHDATPPRAIGGGQ